MTNPDEPRLPAHVEVAGLIRQVQAAGGFATVLSKGERDAGTLIVVLTENDENTKVYERMPQMDGTRAWHCAYDEDRVTKQKLNELLRMRAEQDRDLWIVELDIADGERFIGLQRSES